MRFINTIKMEKNGRKNITYRTRIHYIAPSQELITEAQLSNNLYNQTLYILRQAFINEEKLPSKFDLVKILRHKEYECEEYNNFSKMVSCNAEAIVHLAAQNFKAFLMSLKAFKKNKSILQEHLKFLIIIKKNRNLWLLLETLNVPLKMA